MRSVDNHLKPYVNKSQGDKAPCPLAHVGSGGPGNVGGWDTPALEPLLVSVDALHIIWPGAIAALVGNHPLVVRRP